MKGNYSGKETKILQNEPGLSTIDSYSNDPGYDIRFSAVKRHGRVCGFKLHRLHVY